MTNRYKLAYWTTTSSNRQTFVSQITRKTHPSTLSYHKQNISQKPSSRPLTVPSNGMTPEGPQCPTGTQLPSHPNFLNRKITRHPVLSDNKNSQISPTRNTTSSPCSVPFSSTSSRGYSYCDSHMALLLYYATSGCHVTYTCHYQTRVCHPLDSILLTY